MPYAATSAYFADLAGFIAARTGVRPADHIELLEMPAATVLGFERAEPAGAPPPGAYELLVVDAQGNPTLHTGLGGGRGGPDDARFCTFGPILYACGAPGEVLAWELTPPDPPA